MGEPWKVDLVVSKKAAGFGLEEREVRVLVAMVDIDDIFIIYQSLNSEVGDFGWEPKDEKDKEYLWVYINFE